MLVRPLKVYARKQTTVSMLQKINMNLELLQHVQKVFKKSFDIHPTSKHTKQDSTPEVRFEPFGGIFWEHFVENKNQR